MLRTLDTVIVRPLVLLGERFLANERRANRDDFRPPRGRVLLRLVARERAIMRAY